MFPKSAKIATEMMLYQKKIVLTFKLIGIFCKPKNSKTFVGVFPIVVKLRTRILTKSTILKYRNEKVLRNIVNFSRNLFLILF